MFLVTGVLVATLSGCAGPTVLHGQARRYSRPQEQKDFAECRFEAAKATGSTPGPSFSYDTSGAISNSLMEGVRQNEIMAACLLARGYAPQ